MRGQAVFPGLTRPALARPRFGDEAGVAAGTVEPTEPTEIDEAVEAFEAGDWEATTGVAAPAGRAAPISGPTTARVERLFVRVAFGAAVVVLALSALLVAVRAANDGRIYPAVHLGDLDLGGMPVAEAEAAVAARAAAVEGAEVAFTLDGREWRARLADLGVSVGDEDGLASAYALGREPEAWQRLRSAAALVNADARVPLAVRFDHAPLAAWFDQIDRELGRPPVDASLQLAGANVVVVPEQDGTVVDRTKAVALVTEGLARLQGTVAALPTVAKPARIRAADLGAAQQQLAAAMANPVQVTFGGGLWTLGSAELGRFVKQEVDPAGQEAGAVRLAMDRTALTGWLDERLTAAIDREPQDAEVGWDGEQVVSTTVSIDGVRLQPDKLAELVETSFLGAHEPVEAPVAVTKPEISSDNLDKLGITTLLGRGSSNYSGSTDGRATNVEVGAGLLNGTLVPPHGEFSFNGAIGVINAANGYVEAQVISGESIGKDIGGGICQVSTTVFRAAYLAGLPMTQWYPHRWRIPFYELDGWDPGLDASILQPTEDPATWDDFRFENPSDNWLLVESWTDGVNVVVNIYGPDLGYRVESAGPRYGEKFQVLVDQEAVDPELEPGTITLVQEAAIGEEVGFYREVFDRDGNLLWERNFYTKYYPRGNLWKVSPDMKGKSPANPKRELPPLPDDEPDEGVEGAEGTEAADPAVPIEPVAPEMSVEAEAWEQTAEWQEPAVPAETGEWVEPAPAEAGEWVEPVAPVEEAAPIEPVDEGWVAEEAA